VSPFEGYVEAWRQRNNARRAAARQRAKRAHSIALELARLLRARYGATKVVLFGSLARGAFGPRSDIDLSVEGLAEADIFRAGADAAARAEEFEVDIVPLEASCASLRDEIEREGVVL